MQTHEWEALLDGTTPGGWGRGADPREIYAVDDAGRAVFVGRTYAHNAHSGADADLFASAPAAVAEVVRLHREIEDLLGTLSKAKIDIARGDYEHGQHTAFLFAASQLARILEGDSNE